MGGGSSKRYPYESDSPMENQSTGFSPNLSTTPVSNERSGPCFSDTIQPKDKIATKKEIEELLTFLGGFEKWPVLNDDCRREVVKYLDYKSRFVLGICSKSDHDTVETKILVESVEILENVRSQYQLNRRRKLPKKSFGNHVQPKVSNERSGPCFSDTIQPKDKIATKKEIEELLTFLGGFEKWPVLNDDCRREVVKYLDYKSRFVLGICSKSDHDTVETTKIYVESVEILENARSQYQLNRRRKLDNVSVRIRFPNGKYIEWIFSQLEQDTRVQWLHCIPKKRPVAKEVIWKSCDYYEEAVKFAEKWMKKSNFELEAITVGMAKYPFPNSQIKLLPCCRIVKICAFDVDSFGWWLTKCPEQLDFLQLVVHADHLESFTFPSALLSAPQVIQASKIWFWCQASCSDEQLLKLKAKSIYFDSVDVTDEGINKVLRNWVKGKCVNGFKDLHIKATSVRNPDVIVAGLDYEEWDEDFENEQREFVEDFKRCFGFGRYYQLKSKVDPFESLTMSIHEHCISINATGKRVEKKGKPSTRYRVP